MKENSSWPDVSVVMPAFNSGREIRESILSVLKQTYESLELLVIDDASTDNTASIVKQLCKDDGRVRLLKNETNSGVSFSRNRGTANARGRFLMFLDSDDIWDNRKVEAQVSFMRNNACVVSYMDYFRFSEDNLESAWQVTAPDRITYRNLLSSNEIGMLTAAIDLRRIAPLPKFEDRGHEDYVFWLDILRETAPLPALKVPSPDPLARYRERTGSVSSNRIKSVLWHWNVLVLQKQRFPARFILMAQYIWRAFNKRRVFHRYLSS